MSRVKRNIALSLVGRVSSSAVNLLMLPLYLPLLGKEAFGLVALGVSLVQLIAVLNTGIQPIWVREIARRTAHNESVAPLIRSQEYLRGVFFLLIVVFHQQLATYAINGIKLKELPPETEVSSLGILLVGLAFTNMGATYGLVLWGKQDGVKTTLINTIKPIWDSVGGYFVLLATSGSPFAFFCWQAAGAALMTLITGVIVWWPNRKEFLHWRLRGSDFKGLGRLGGASLLLTALLTAVAFADRWFVGVVLSVSVVATFSLLMGPIALIGTMTGMVGTYLIPRFSELLAMGNAEQMSRTFGKATKVSMMLVLPAVAALTAAPEELYLLWLRNPAIAAEIRLLAPTAVITAALWTQLVMLYEAEIARGNLGFYIAMVAARLLMALTLWHFLLTQYGLIGMLTASMVFTVTECFVAQHFILRPKSPTAGLQWLRNTLLLPSLILMTTFGVVKLSAGYLAGFDSFLAVGAVKLAISISITAAAFVIMPSTRAVLLEIITYIRGIVCRQTRTHEHT